MAVERAAGQVDAALLILDPLMSRLDASLDTHRDGEVRRALEPLASLADRASLAVLGLIHHNKSGSTDPLQVVMASKAFTAVARSVHSVIRDPDDDTDMRRLFGTPKNNLGRTDQPTLAFTIASYAVDTDDGTAWTGRVEWAGEVAGTIRDAMGRGNDDGDRTATAEAGDWLDDYLTSCGGEASSADVKKAGQAAGHSADCLKRAKRRLGIGDRSEGFPRRTMWNLPDPAVGAPDAPTVGAPVGAQSAQETRGDAPTALTNSQSAPTVQVRPQSAQSAQSEHPRETGAPTVLRLARTTDTTPCPGCNRQTASATSTSTRHLRHLPPRRQAGDDVTITTTEQPSADDRPCSSCSARAGSCSVRQWLSGRPCCDGCSHPTTDPEAHR